MDNAILVLQIGVGALGIDLTAAHYCVFYSPDYSLTTYLQARDRLHRHGQTHKVTYYHLIATGLTDDETGTPSVDQRLYEALNTKRDVMRGVLDKKRLKELFT